MLNRHLLLSVAATVPWSDGGIFYRHRRIGAIFPLPGDARRTGAARYTADEPLRRKSFCCLLYWLRQKPFSDASQFMPFAGPTYAPLIEYFLASNIYWWWPPITSLHIDYYCGVSISALPHVFLLRGAAAYRHYFSFQALMLTIFYFTTRQQWKWKCPAACKKGVLMILYIAQRSASHVYADGLRRAEPFYWL